MHKIVLADASLVPLGTSPLSGRRAGGRHGITTTCATLLIFALGQAAVAAPGDLDPSFDADGLVLTHFGGIDSDSGSSVVVQPDGKLVVAGGSDSSGTFKANELALARYNSDGSLDTSFGSGGRVLTDFGGNDFARTLIVQPDGKLVAGVLSFGATGNDVLALARYNQDGSLDATFGSGGRVLMSNLSGGIALVTDPGGKLVATAISFDEETASRPWCASMQTEASMRALVPEGSLPTLPKKPKSD